MVFRPGWRTKQNVAYTCLDANNVHPAIGALWFNLTPEIEAGTGIFLGSVESEYLDLILLDGKNIWLTHGIMIPWEQEEASNVR